MTKGSEPPGRGPVARVRLVRILLGAGLLLSFAAPAAWKFGGEDSYLAELALYVPLPLLLLAGGLLIGLAAGTARRASKLGWLLVPVLSGAALKLTLPYDAHPLDRGSTFRLMTFNMNWGTYRGIPAVAEAILDAEPDVVCLQEVSPHPPPHKDPVELKRRLSGFEFHWVGEMMIASRFPIVERHATELPGNYASRPLLEVDLDIKGRRIRVMDAQLIYTHAFGFSPSGIGRMLSVRDVQLSVVEERVAVSPYPVVLAGDLNFSPFHAAQRRLEKTLSEAPNDGFLSWPATIPSGFPMRRLDHVLSGPGISPLRSWVPNANASDHEPLVADLSLSLHVSKEAGRG